MECSLRSQVKLFLDDLLDELLYQKVALHLDACQLCQKLAAASGSLSHAIWLLGQTKMPEDLTDAAYYEYQHFDPCVESGLNRQNENTAMSTAWDVSGLTKKGLWAGGIIILAIMAVFFLKSQYFHQNDNLVRDVKSVLYDIESQKKSEHRAAPAFKIHMTASIFEEFQDYIQELQNSIEKSSGINGDVGNIAVSIFVEA